MLAVSVGFGDVKDDLGSHWSKETSVTATERVEYSPVYHCVGVVLEGEEGVGRVPYSTIILTGFRTYTLVPPLTRRSPCRCCRVPHVYEASVGCRERWNFCCRVPQAYEASLGCSGQVEFLLPGPTRLRGHAGVSSGEVEFLPKAYEELLGCRERWNFSYRVPHTYKDPRGLAKSGIPLKVSE